MKRGEKDYRRLAGEVLFTLRKREGWTQEEFGQQMGEHLGIPPISRVQVGRYEIDPSEPPDEQPEREAPAYWFLALKIMTGRSLDSLFDEVDQEGLRAEVAELRRLVQSIMGDGKRQ